MLLLGVAALPACLLAQESNDSVQPGHERELDLNEVVVVANRNIFKLSPDGIIYLTKNDPYALGMNGMEILNRIPRISVTNDQVSVAGKSSVKYIIDGHLLEMPDEAIALRLKNIQSSSIEKIELLTTPPAKYAAAGNVAFISITTYNETLGTRGNIWGNGTVREDFSYLLGGNVNHSTRKVEFSADISLQDTRGINDLVRTFTFSDCERTSTRTNHFRNRSLGANGLFKFKINDMISIGGIFNFSTIRLKSNLWDETIEENISYSSRNQSPEKPNNAITLTGFADWLLDNSGKLLSFTYNFFNRHIHSFSDVTTGQNENDPTRLTDDGKNKYRIQSVKIDAVLPFPTFRIDAGAAFTGTINNTFLQVSDHTDRNRIVSVLESNNFMYDEKTAALYVSAEKNFSGPFFGKFGLRYEHTDVKGLQMIDNSKHHKSYRYLFPTLNLSLNTRKTGRFSISYSMGITRPNFTDLNPFRYYTTVKDWFSGNPYLGPSISHNTEINYSFKGVYGVIYNSYIHNAIGNITRFTADGSLYTIPENCLNTNKTGLYASYTRSLFSFWNFKVGGDVFYSVAKTSIPDFRETEDYGWSGKLELNTSWMLNRRKTLILNLRFSHYFPWHDRMIHYSSISLIGCDIRYSLLNNRLNMSIALNDPFGWNITKSKAYYRDYLVTTNNDIHSHSFTFRLSWSFGRNKVIHVYRDSKEHESQRAF